MAYGQLGSVLQHLRRLLGAQEAADLTDAQLLARFRDSRDETAFAALLQRHGPLVLNVCRRVLGNADDADDAFQAVFLVLARKAGSIRRHESLGSWLYGVAYRVALRARSNAARRRSHEREAESMSPAAADSRAAWDELRPILDEELNRLPEKYRTSIVLRYLQGKSNEEAAREAGCPTGTMSWRLAHGLDLLRQRLDRRGIALPACGLAALLSDHAAAAALSPPLSAAALQAAVGFAAGQTAGISLTILTLAEGALKAMFLTKLKLTLALLLAVSVAGLGAGWVSWNLLGRGTPTALAVPLPLAEPKPMPRNPHDSVVSESVVVNEAAFRLETSGVWFLPPPGGQRSIPLALRIENQSKDTRQFTPWRGNVVLLTGDGKPVKLTVHGRDGTRARPKPIALDNGKELTAAEPAQLGDGSAGTALSWMDITGTVSTFDDLKPGKYRVALQYTITGDATEQWTGDAITKPVEIEIRETTAQAVEGLELQLTADRTETTLKAGGGIEPVKLRLTFTNVGSKPITLNTYSVQAWGSKGNFLRIVGPDGKELERQPQPPAPPAAPRVEQFPVLRPGMTWQYTINFPTPLFRLNAAGEYRLRASYGGGEATTPHPTPAFARGSWTGKLESNELVLKVNPAGNAAAGQPVNGLQLTLSADRLETSMRPDGQNAVPVNLSLVFTNVSDRPLKLDVYDLVWRHLKLDLTGPDAGSIGVTRQLVEWEKRAPEARDFPTLQPQQRWERNAIITLPGRVAIVDPQAAPGTYYQDFTFRKPRAYRLLLTYACPQVDGNPLAKDSWTGVVASNEVVLMVSPAK